MTIVRVDIVREFLERDEEFSASLVDPRARVRLGHWFRPSLWPVSVVYLGLWVTPRRVAPKPTVSFIFKQGGWIVRADANVSWGGKPSGEEYKALLRGHCEALLLAIAAELELPSPPALVGRGRIESSAVVLSPKFEWVVQGKRFVPVESSKGAVDVWRFFPGGLDEPVQFFLEAFESLEGVEQDRVAGAVCGEIDGYFEALAAAGDGACRTDGEAEHAAGLLCGGAALWAAVLDDPLRFRDVKLDGVDDSGEIIDAISWG